LRALSELGNHSVDVLAFPEGSDLNYQRVNIERLPDFRWLRRVKPGFSFKKLVLDLLMLKRCLRLCWTERYDVVHCVEETVYIGMLLKFFFALPYVYDMDSSLAQQMVERFPLLRFVSFFLTACERLAISNSMVVVPVCPVLTERALSFGASRVQTLHDITLLKKPRQPSGIKNQLIDQSLLLLYVGNFEAYQGIELMMESFAIVAPDFPRARLVVAGQGDSHRLESLTRRLNITHAVRFIGPWPLERLAELLADADILISPRVKGTNTPMKLYSYLHSGKPVLATRLQTHTQIISESEAALAEPTPSKFALAMRALMKDKESRQALGRAGQALVEKRYTYRQFLKTVEGIYP